MTDYAWPNLVTMFFDQVETRGESPFLWAKREGKYQALTWREAAAQVTELARALTARGVKPGDRVMLVSENRPEWAIADLAIMAAGGITVPAYVTNTEADHRHVVEDSDARGAIVSTRRLAETFLPAAHASDAMTFCITMEQPRIEQRLNVDVVSWADAIETGGEGHGNVAQAARALGPDDTACIIYTSGTGGAPKGVMLSHRAILHNCMGARDALLELGLGDEVFLSFLPLSHSYEHSAGLYFPIAIGAQIYYAEGVETLAKNLTEARPTIMTAVPRLYELFHTRIMKGITAQGGLKEKLFLKAVALGTKRYHDPASLGLGERLVDALLTKLVRSKVEERFGGRLKALVSGGAPLNPDIGIFFNALGLCILQGYGQTESAPVVAVNRPRDPRMHTVGPPLINTEVKIADDGEILIRGDLVMQGYWRNEDATRDTVRDGWLHTGDIGKLDEAGRLMITDRKKDIIVNSGGDNISPQRIEGILTLEPEIAQAMVYGDRKPHLVALVVPDAEWLTQWARTHKKAPDLPALADDADLRAALSGVIDRVNKDLSNIEKLRRFLIAAEPFSIDNEQMTPTLKVRRHVVKAVYGERLEGLYR